MPLDDVVRREPAVDLGYQKQRDGDQEEAQHLVYEVAPRPDQRAVVERLLHRVIRLELGVRALAQDGEALVEVARYEGQEGDDGEDDVRDERVCYGREGGGEAVVFTS